MVAVMAVSLGVKWAGYEAFHPPASNTGVKSASAQEHFYMLYYSAA